MIFERLGTKILSVESFFSYIDRNFFTPEFKDLENINITADTFKWVVLAIYFGFLLAAVAIYYNRVVIGALPRALIKNGCDSQENARTLAELGCDKNPFLRLSLKFGSTFSRIVHCVEGDNFESDPKNLSYRSKFLDLILPEKRYKINFKTDRFYIPERYRDSCAQRFEKKGNGPISLILCAVGGLVAVVLIMRFAPNLLSMIDDLVGGLSEGTGGNTIY